VEVADGGGVAPLEESSSVHRSLVRGGAGRLEKVPEKCETGSENGLGSLAMRGFPLHFHVMNDLLLRHGSDTGAKVFRDENGA